MTSNRKGCTNMNYFKGKQAEGDTNKIEDIQPTTIEVWEDLLQMSRPEQDGPHLSNPFTHDGKDCRSLFGLDLETGELVFLIRGAGLTLDEAIACANEWEQEMDDLDAGG